MNPLSTRPNRCRPITVLNLVLGLLFSLSALAQPELRTNITVQVPATSSIWLSKVTDSGINLEGDTIANANPFNVATVPISKYEFGYLTFEANGIWSNASGGPSFGPNGSNPNIIPSTVQQSILNQYGIAPVLAPFGALIGVFVDDTAPTPIGIFTPYSRDTANYTAQLNTPFCIGDGNSANSVRLVVNIPKGAKRLYLGMNDSGCYNNSGALTVNINTILYNTPPDNSFITNGLVAYYPFNGNANDESGNENNGTPIKSSFVEDGNGFNASAIRFNNNLNNFVSADSVSYVRTPKGLLSKSYKQGTISVWIMPDNGIGGILCKAAPTVDSSPVFTYGGYSQNSGWSILGEPGTVYFRPKNGGSLMSSNGKLKIGSWNHIVISYSESGSSIYLNGKIDSISNGQNYSLNPTDAPDGYNAIGGYLWDNDGSRGHPNLYSNGVFDDVRIYSRTLSDAEVKALYDYESAPQPLNPRIASATAQIVNGFVVGATITDGGYGYVSNPVITITGGGGTGAKATATQFNGVVTSITITNPGIGYTSAPTITIAPPPFPPRKATSTAQIVNGFVVGTKITDGGFGYDSPPTVLLVGGGGSGATAVATVANGVVTAITITNPGTGYTSAPLVRIASPPFAPKLAIETSKVYVRMSVVLGRKYQLEASTDLNTWTTTGPAFIAQDEELAQEFDVNQVGRYFRINQVP